MKFVQIVLLMGCLGVFSTARADTNDPLIKVQYGLGIGKISDGKILNSADKFLNVGYYNKLNNVLGWDVHGGILTQNNAMSGFMFVQFGAELNPFDWMYVDHYFGPGFITTKGNQKLTGHFQFGIHVGFGWRDPSKKTTIGLSWKHISNAGIMKPNHGMDGILAQIGIPL